MRQADDAGSEPDTPGTDPLTTEDAIRRLGDEAFLELLGDVWKRRRWTVEDVHDPGTWYVDLFLHDGWPIEERVLARIKRPDSKRQVSGTEVGHFVRTVQQEEVDRGELVVPSVAPRSTRNRGAKFDVEVVDSAELARQLDAWGDHDLLAEHVGRSVVPDNDSPVAYVPDPVVRALDRADVSRRIERTLDGLLPSDPTADDVSRLSFTAFRILFGFAGVTFLLALVTESGSLLSSLLWGVFLFCTYVALPPSLAADIYVVGRFEETEWTPSWWALASFVLVPILFVVGTVYWYRRRTRTPGGRSAAW